MTASEFLDRIKPVGSSKETIGRDSEITVILDRFEKILNNAIQKKLESDEDIGIVFEEHKQALQNVYDALQAVKESKSDETFYNLDQELDRTNKVDSISRKLLVGHPQEDYEIMSENLEASKYLRDNRDELLSVLERYNASQTRSLEPIRSTLKLIESESLKNNKLPLQYEQLNKLERRFSEEKGTDIVRQVSDEFDEVYENMSLAATNQDLVKDLRDSITELAEIFREENDRRNYNSFGAKIESQGSFESRALSEATIAMNRLKDTERMSLRNMTPYEITDVQEVRGEEQKDQLEKLQRDLREQRESSSRKDNRVDELENQFNSSQGYDSADNVEDRDAVNADSRQELAQLADNDLKSDVRAIRENLEDLVRILLERREQSKDEHEDKPKDDESDNSEGLLSRLGSMVGGLAEGIGSLAGGILTGKGMRGIFNLGGRRANRLGRGSSIRRPRRFRGIKGLLIGGFLTSVGSYLLSEEGRSKLSHLKNDALRNSIMEASSEEEINEILDNMTDEQQKDLDNMFNDNNIQVQEGEPIESESQEPVQYNLTPAMQQFQERQKAYQNSEASKVLDVAKIQGKKEAGVGGAMATLLKLGWRGLNYLATADYVLESFPQAADYIAEASEKAGEAISFIDDPTGIKREVEENKKKADERLVELERLSSDPVAAQAVIEKLGLTDEDFKKVEQLPRVEGQSLLTAAVIKKLAPEFHSQSQYFKDTNKRLEESGLFDEEFKTVVGKMQQDYSIASKPQITSTDRLNINPSQAVEVVSSTITETGERGVTTTLYQNDWAREIRASLQKNGITDENLQNAMITQLAVESGWGKEGTQAEATNNWANMNKPKSWKGPVTVARDTGLAGEKVTANRPIFKDTDEFMIHYLQLLKSGYNFTGNETPDEFFAKLDGENSGGRRWAVAGNYRQAMFNTMYSTNAPIAEVVMRQGDQIFTGNQLAEIQDLGKVRKGGSVTGQQMQTSEAVIGKLKTIDRQQEVIDSTYLPTENMWVEGKWNSESPVSSKFYNGDIVNTKLNPNIFTLDDYANKSDKDGNVTSVYVDAVTGEPIKIDDLVSRDKNSVREVSVESSEYKQLVYDMLKNREDYYSKEEGDSEAVANLKAMANATRQAIIQKPESITAFAAAKGIEAFERQKISSVPSQEGRANISAPQYGSIDPNKINLGEVKYDITKDIVDLDLSKFESESVGEVASRNKFVGEEVDNLLGQQYIDAEGQSTFVKTFDEETADIVAGKDFLGRTKRPKEVEPILKQEDWKKLREKVDAAKGDVFAVTEPRYLRGDDPMMEKFTIVDAKRPPMKEIEKKKESPQPKAGPVQPAQSPLGSYQQITQTFIAPDNNIQSNFANIGTW